jgi:D-alanine-D-alanine ligase
MLMDIKAGIATGAKPIRENHWLGGWPTRIASAHTVPGLAEAPRATEDLLARIPGVLKHLRIAVVHGGDKEQPGAVLYRSANTRPWKSYREVAADIAGALTDLGCGFVSLVPEDMRLISTLRQQRINFAWLNSGGMQGENPVGHGAALLEMLGVPYLGHTPLAAALLDEKDAFKRQLQGLGIPTAPFLTWHPGVADWETRMQSVFGSWSGPFVVKPVSGRASLHVNVVGRAEEVAGMAARVQERTHKGVLVERYLPGREFCVAVSGSVVCRGGSLSRLPGPFAFSALERRLEPGEAIFTSMDRKAITADRATLVGPGALREELFELGRKIYQEFDLRSVVRVDIRADEEDRLHVLEANPKPDLKRPGPGVTSLVALGLPEEGMSYHDLILGLLAERLHGLLEGHLEGPESLRGLVA